MAIIDLQRRLREAGRIRIGEQVATSNGKTRPSKLDKFRFTSADKSSMDAIAEVYGGDVRVWEGASVGIQWELYAETTVLDVIVPPVDLAFSQFMELWKGGGCERRCDGQINLMNDKPCVCDPDAPECKPTTRLGVILTAVQGIGVWRCESHGWNSAQELNGAIEILRVVQNGGRGRMVPARLMLEQRQSKKDGKTFNYAVPVLDLNLSVAALTQDHGHPEIEKGNVTPIKRNADAVLSLEDQLSAVDDPGRLKPSTRANAATPLPATGLVPRPAPLPVSEDLPTEQTEVKQEKKKGPAVTEGGATQASLRRIMALLNGHPDMPKGTDEQKQTWRHDWARDILILSPKTPVSFAKFDQEFMNTLIKAAEEAQKTAAVAPTPGTFDADDPERPF